MKTYFRECFYVERKEQPIRDEDVEEFRLLGITYRIYSLYSGFLAGSEIEFLYFYT